MRELRIIRIFSFVKPHGVAAYRGDECMETIQPRFEELASLRIRRRNEDLTQNGTVRAERRSHARQLSRLGPMSLQHVEQTCPGWIPGNATQSSLGRRNKPLGKVGDGPEPWHRSLHRARH